MRRAPLFLAALMVCACSGDGLSRTSSNGLVPSAPTPPTSPTSPTLPAPVDTIFPAAKGWLQVMVIGQDGACIDGAMIEIVSGPGTGFSGKQSAQCSVWEPWAGLFLYGLVVAEPIIIRASAPGYGSAESTFHPSADPGQSGYFITLSKVAQPPIPNGDPMLELAH